MLANNTNQQKRSSIDRSSSITDLMQVINNVLDMKPQEYRINPSQPNLKSPTILPRIQDCSQREIYNILRQRQHKKQFRDEFELPALSQLHIQENDLKSSSHQHCFKPSPSRKSFSTLRQHNNSQLISLAIASRRDSNPQPLKPSHKLSPSTSPFSRRGSVPKQNNSPSDPEQQNERLIHNTSLISLQDHKQLLHDQAQSYLSTLRQQQIDLKELESRVIKARKFSKSKVSWKEVEERQIESSKRRLTELSSPLDQQLNQVDIQTQENKYLSRQRLFFNKETDKVIERFLDGLHQNISQFSPHVIKESTISILKNNRRSLNLETVLEKKKKSLPPIKLIQDEQVVHQKQIVDETTQD